MRITLLGLAAVVIAAQISCGGDDLLLPPQGEPAVITVVEGGGQSGRVGEALTEPIVFEVLDGADRPVPEATVVIDLAGATVEPDTVTTDEVGRASVAITLGSTVGESNGAARVIAAGKPGGCSDGFHGHRGGLFRERTRGGVRRQSERLRSAASWPSRSWSR